MIAILVIATIMIGIASIIIFTGVSKNVLDASYFTAAALLDASSLGSDVGISAHVQPFTGAFYAVMGTAVVDGLAKSVIVGFVLAEFISFITNIDVRAKFGLIMKKSEKNHIIVCGYSMLAERLCRDLADKKRRFVVIEKDPERANAVRDMGYDAINGDPTDKQALEEASISTAKAVVFATESDFINLLGVVTARHMNNRVKIITRAMEGSTVTKMHRGGANFCIVPEAVAGTELGSRIAGG
jgi:voltage-gated potassium channel